MTLKRMDNGELLQINVTRDENGKALVRVFPWKWSPTEETLEAFREEASEMAKEFMDGEEAEVTITVTYLNS